MRPATLRISKSKISNKNYKSMRFDFLRFFRKCVGVDLNINVSEHSNGDIIISTDGNVRSRNVC